MSAEKLIQFELQLISLFLLIASLLQSDFRSVITYFATEVNPQENVAQNLC